MSFSAIRRKADALAGTRAKEARKTVCWEE